MPFRFSALVVVLALASWCSNSSFAADPPSADNPLERELLKTPAKQLAAESRKHGSATRGAILFHQPALVCTKCHSVGEQTSKLGPDLARWKERPTAESLVEAVLQPAKSVRKGYEAVTVVTNVGKTFTGLLQADDAGKIVLRDPSRDGKLIEIPKKDVELRKDAGSIMPQGLVNQFANRQQFLDVAKYLIEIAEGGLERAKELQPPDSLFALPPAPEYEKRVDHAGLISSLDRKSFERGREIYQRLCINCHGTVDRPGNLPTSPRFAAARFKNGGDPYGMYQTLTSGFGMMVPQRWMVPQQKYDVIHYIRETFLKPHNPSQLVAVDKDYLQRLPKGDTRGPKPSPYAPWENMNYGPFLAGTYEAGDDGRNIAYKGIAVRLDNGPGGVSRGRRWMIFDHDTLRASAAWSGKKFIDYNGILFNGRHNAHPRLPGRVHWENPTAPGWANPETGSFEDPRLRGRDGKPYGPLPRKWAHYKGIYRYGNLAVVSYTVGTTNVLESPGADGGDSQPVFTRTFHLGPRERDLVLQAAHLKDGAMKNPAPNNSGRTVVFGAKKSDRAIVAGTSGDAADFEWLAAESGDLRLKIPAGKQPLKFTLSIAAAESGDEAKQIAARFDKQIEKKSSAIDLTAFTKGGPPQWPQKVTTKVATHSQGGAFEADVLARPAANPWFARVRMTGLDFLPDGKTMAVCTWDGDVWLVDGWAGAKTGDTLTWRRIASGLFQPLGIRCVADSSKDGSKSCGIYVSCRDQIVRLHDLNGDGEIDFYENFNNDHQVTEHFHEFAMGLQTDDDGNFYYAKSARHALPAIVPHHGTLLRVGKDGKKTEILANGFRAANGVCLNPDGTFYVTDQEGHWTPKNRINLVKKGGFYGNMLGYHDESSSDDDAMQQPLCWITNAFDRSPAELLWVNSDAWGALNGSLLNLSYGYGKVFVVLREEVEGRMQGGMCELPLPAFPTGVIRGRFNPNDGQLYACGMFAWAGSRQQPGGLYRIRRTDKPVHLPVGLNARQGRLVLTFTSPLDRKSIADLANYSVRVWSLKRTKNYGSKHVDEHPLKLTKAGLSRDGKQLTLHVPDLKPTWCMEIKYRASAADGSEVKGVIHNTIHRLAD